MQSAHKPLGEVGSLEGIDTMENRPHWLDAAAMLAKASRDLKFAATNADTLPEGVEAKRTQDYLKSALHNITAAIARFESDIVR